MAFPDFNSLDGTPRPGTGSEIEQLRALLYSDDLTGLYNRRFFRHCVAEQKLQSDVSGAPFALLIMDVDHFKQINDTYGHATGDMTLIRVAAALKEEIRDIGWVFRYAGDEFVAILRNSDEQQAQSVCSRILSSTSTGIRFEEAGFPLRSLSLSIGFAIYPNDGTNISELMELADRALYASKEAGRNCISSASEVSNRDRDESEKWPIKVHCQTLIARQRQWTQLREYFNECKNGHGRLLFLTGQAGIGKSRLLRQFTRRLRASDYHILFGECTEGTLIHSYAPVRDALNKGFEAKDPFTVSAYKDLDQNYRRELLALVPQFARFEKTPLAPANSPDRYLLLEGILLLLQGLARQLPTIMILEDIHWGDDATLNLLRYLARNIRDDKILLIATFREEEAIDSPLPAILQNMSRENLFDTIALRPLSRQDSSQMIREVFRGYTVSDTLPDWIHEETEGNPFYTEELLKVLLEEGYLTRINKEIAARKPEHFLLPYSIKALIHRRISRISEPLQRVLGYASIIGQEFELSLLVKLIEENEGYLVDLLENLTRMQLIREGPSFGEERYVFSHKKIRDVIYEDMGVIKRRKFHKRVGEILEGETAYDSHERAELLAYHFERAGEIAKAFTYSKEAGKKAFAVHAYSDAQMYFNRCFQYRDLLDNCSPEELADLYNYKGLTFEALELWEEAIHCFEQLLLFREADPSTMLEVDGLNHLSRIFYKREDFAKSVALAEQALQISKEKEYLAGICSSYQNLGKSYWKSCNYDIAMKNMQAAIKISEEQNDWELKAKLLNSAGIILFEESQYQNAVQYFQQAMDLFKSRNDKGGLIRCLVNFSVMRHVQGNLLEARQHLVDALALAHEIGDPLSIAACAVNQAEIEYKVANYEVATRMNQRANRIYNQFHSSEGLTYVLQNEAYYKMMLGTLQEAMQCVQKAKKIAEEKRLRRRVLELSKEEASINYYRGSYTTVLDGLKKIIALADSFSDLSTKAEATLKTGFVYFALKDPQTAARFWSEGVGFESSNSSVDFLFWKAASGAYLAALEKNENELDCCRNQMFEIAKRTENAYFQIASHLLYSYQLQLMETNEVALEHAREGERLAGCFKQSLWIARSRLRVIELEAMLGNPPQKQLIRQLLKSATEQDQQALMFACLQLLEQEEELQQHWESWRHHLPESHQPNFR